MCYSALIRRELESLSKNFGAKLDYEKWQIIRDHERSKNSKIKLWDNNSSGGFYPNYHTPVFHYKEEILMVSPMRYSAYPPNYIAEDSPSAKRLSTFNVRKDRIDAKFWAQAFGHHHGFVVLKGFREWVQVKDLLKARVVLKEEILESFEKKIVARKKRWIGSGKNESNFKLTKAEQTSVEFKMIMIEFRPDNATEFLVPVIFSKSQKKFIDKNTPDRGFAMITDDPLPEVAAAGHDRTPIIMNNEQALEWIKGPSLNLSRENLLKLLEVDRSLSFRHSLPLAA